MSANISSSLAANLVAVIRRAFARGTIQQARILKQRFAQFREFHVLVSQAFEQVLGMLGDHTPDFRFDRR